MREDRLKEANFSYQKAQKLFLEIDEREGLADTFRGLGNLALAEKDADKSPQLLLRALKLHKMIADSYGLRRDFEVLGRWLMFMDDPFHAVLAYESSLRILSVAADGYGYRLSLEGQAEAFNVLGLNEGAAACLSVGDGLAKNGGERLAVFLGELEDKGANEAACRLRRELAENEPETIRRKCVDKLETQFRDNKVSNEEDVVIINILREFL